MSTVGWVLVGVLVLSAVLAALMAAVASAGKRADRDEEGEVRAMFGRLGRRAGERRTGVDRRLQPTVAVEHERRRGERRWAGDRRDPQSRRDDREDAQP